MEKSFLSITVLLVLLLGSCSSSRSHLSVFRGNQDYLKGNFQEANLKYLQPLDDTQGKYDEWIHYNLGNTYFVLGESSSAEAEWAQALGTTDRALLFSIYFNLGVYYYDEGRYEDAYVYFRKSLEIDRTVMDAKINLELSLEKIESRASGQPKAVNQAEETGNEQEDYTDRVLEYVKRKEEERWVSPDVSEEPGPINDW